MGVTAGAVVVVTGASVVGGADAGVADADDMDGLSDTDELVEAVPAPPDPSVEHAESPAMASTDHTAIVAHISRVVMRRRAGVDGTDVRIMSRSSDTDAPPLLRAAKIHAIARRSVRDLHRRQSPRSW